MNPPTTSVETPRYSPTQALLFVVFLALGFAAQMWRNSHESTFWCDEIYSTMLANRPLPELIDLTSVDAHPPFYYFVARAWLLLGRALGFEPGILWMRGLNMVGWTAMATTLWFAGRRLFGAWPGAMGAIACVAAGGMTEAFRNLRNYTFVCPSILGCAVILAFALRHGMDRDRPQSTASAAAMWALYAVLGSLALWMHLLSALALTALGLTWIAAAVALWRMRGWSMAAPFVVGGAIGQTAIIVGFLPWLAVVGRQLDYIASADLPWMSPPTLYNMLRVYAVWYPMGNVVILREGIFTQPTEAFALGLLSFLVMWSTGLLAAMRPAEVARRASHGTMAAAAVLVSVALLNVGIQLIVTVLGISKTFHGPRYPWITAPVFCMAMGGVTALVIARFGWPRWAAGVLLAPWMAACIYGNWWVVSREGWRGIEGMRGLIGEVTQEGRHPIYLAPWPLYPVHRHSLRGFDVRPLAEAFDTPTSESLHLLNLNAIFYETDWVEDSLDLAVLTAPDVSDSVRQWIIPPGVKDYHLFQVIEPNIGEMRARRRAALARLSRPGPPEAIAIAHGARQRRADGWSSPSFSSRGRVGRWGQRQISTIRFDQPVPAGRWRLIVRGYRLPIPRETETLTMRVQGSGDVFEYKLPPGPFELASEFAYTGGDEPLALSIEHPLAHYEHAVDARRGIFNQSVRFDEGWIEPITPAPPAGSPGGALGESPSGPGLSTNTDPAGKS